MPDFVGGSASSEQEFASNLQLLLRAAARGGRRFTVGTLIGGIRTKQFPENPIAGQPTSIVYVATVRLREFPGEPVVVDALVSNQAHQLVAGSDADGTPVTVELSRSGTVTVVGRAAYTGPSVSVGYSAITDVFGIDLAYVFGLRSKNTSDLPASLLADLNAWRVSQGLPAFGNNDPYIEDPSIDFNGAAYYRAYIGLTDGGRFFSSAAGLVCSEETIRRDLFRADISDVVNAGYDPWSDQEALAIEGFPASADPWSASIVRTTCS